MITINNKILNQLQYLNDFLQEMKPPEETIIGICKMLKDFTNSNVVFINITGKIQSFSIDKQEDNDIVNYTDVKSLYEYIQNYEIITLPLTSSDLTTGTIILFKESDNFKQEHILFSQICKININLILGFLRNEEKQRNIRENSIIKSVLGNLSYSELAAIIHVFKVLDKDEGLIVTSKIADKFNITRSVIVNGLQKLESAGIIESRSLGMKGTYIKILNNYLIKELNRLSR